MLYRIGEFSKKVNASIRTLRYYDNIDLFKPQQIDLFTNYRYYSDEQIADFNIIYELKDLGFSLDEIRDNWNKFDNDVLLKKRQELIENKNDLDNKIKRIDELRSRISNGKFVETNNAESSKVKSLFK